MGGRGGGVEVKKKKKTKTNEPIKLIPRCEEWGGDGGRGGGGDGGGKLRQGGVV